MYKKLKSNLFIFLFAVSAVAVIVLSIFAGLAMNNSAQLLTDASLKQLVALSQAASGMVVAEDFEEFLEPEDMERPDYLELKQRLIEFCEKNNLAYTYFLRNRPEIEMQSFIIDNTPVNYTALAEDPVIPEPATDIAYAGTANAVPIGSYSEGWEGYMTAYAPVYYADGSLSDIIVGVDMIDVNIRKEEEIFRIMAVALIISLVVVLSAGVISVIMYQKKARQSTIASVSKSTFLSNTSHEMRTPMNAIIGMSEIARKSDDMAQIHHCLDRIDGAAQHLLGIINDVLDISKIEAGKLTLSESSFEIRRMVQDISGVVSFSMDSKNQKLLTDISNSIPEYLIADRQRLSQVITNLLSNAIKFTPDDGQIELKITAVDNDSMLQFSVIDNGIGISPEKQKKLFAAFEQADDSISRRYGGTGLGLAISKTLVNMMGGEIWVESEPDKGSCFIFTIPNRQGEASEAEEFTRAQYRAGIQRGAYKGKRMLLAEDIDVNREILLILLQDTELKIDIAENGKIAVDSFRQNPKSYDVIMMDIQMPEMDGYTATRTIREMSSEIPEAGSIPIIAMTANVFKEDIDHCIEAGMNGHLGKPINISELIDVLDGFLLK